MNKDMNRIHIEDLKIVAGVCMFILFVGFIYVAGKSRSTSIANEKLRKQISYLQHDIEVLKSTVKTDIIDREGQLPYNQVAGHLKSLGL